VGFWHSMSWTRGPNPRTALFRLPQLFSGLRLGKLTTTLLSEDYNDAMKDPLIPSSKESSSHFEVLPGAKQRKRNLPPMELLSWRLFRYCEVFSYDKLRVQGASWLTTAPILAWAPWGRGGWPSAARGAAGGMDSWRLWHLTHPACDWSGSSGLTFQAGGFPR
jgi:hypothetical protein